MKTVAIIQARMGSGRLPGKIMLQLVDQPVLGHLLNRLSCSLRLDQVVIATTDKTADDAIEQLAHNRGVEVFRGSETDVLSRYYNAAQLFNADHIIRITSDCPLLDPVLLDRMVAHYHAILECGEEVDYLSNTLQRTYPRGLDIEIFSMAALSQCQAEATQDYEREHVTPYIYQHPEKFTIQHFLGERDLSAYRWTLDTREDWQFIQTIYQALYQEGKIISTADVLDYLELHPELSEINAHIEQKSFARGDHG